MPPLFSVVVPTYNRADHLPVALQSVRNQTFTDWELIVVDDGSTDGTRAAVTPFLRDDRVVYHHQENRELNGARNTGTRLARGRYVCYLDDDDRYLPDHLATLAAAIGAHGSAYGIYATNIVIDYGTRQTVAPALDNGRDMLPQFWAGPRNYLGLAVERSLPLADPFDESEFRLDDFLWLQQTLVRTRLHFTDRATAVYVQHPQNRTKTHPNAAVVRQSVAKLRAAYAAEGVRERVGDAIFRGQLRHQYFHLAGQLGARRRPGPGLAAWWRGVRTAGVGPLRPAVAALGRALVSYRRTN